VSAGKTFDLTVTGAGLPYNESAAYDGSGLQRVKLVRSGESCTAPLPAEVDGLYCIESGKVSTLCGPKPTSATVSTATFSGLTVGRANVDRSYDVCYCAVDCVETYRWQKVPGSLDVPASVHKWASSPETVLRKNEDLSSEFTITVTAPADLSFETNADWELKLVRDWFGCDLEQDTSLFQSVAVDTNENVAAIAPAAAGAAAGAFAMNDTLADGKTATKDHYYYYFNFHHGAYPGPTPNVTTFSAPGYVARGAPTAYGTRDCNGPDECKWTFKSTVPLEDVGHYLVCFRKDTTDDWMPMPSTEGLTALEIEALPADRTHPRGIFHNQYFSALAGAPSASAQTLAGSTIAIPTNGALTVTAGTCGDLSSFSFPGSFVTASSDTTPPEVVTGDCFPTGTIKTGLGTSWMVVFNEPVKLGTGYFNFYEVGGVSSPVQSIGAENATFVSGNKILLEPELTAGTYYLEIETGAVEDMAGNAMSLQVMAGIWEVTIDDTHGSHPAPKVLMTDPAPDSTAALSTVTFYFSDEVTPNAGSISVKLCPDSGVCADGGVVESFPATGFTSYNETITLTMTAAVSDGAMYEFTVPAGIVKNTDSTASTEAFTLEAEKSAGGFDPAKHVVFMDSATSTADALAFAMQLSADTAPGQYKVCYCSGQSDVSLAVLGDGDKTYELTEDVKCAGNPVDLSSSASTLLDMDLKEHECEVKCASGCVGPHCYCDGYAEAKRNYAGALCLPKHLCADACDLETGCVGINVHDDLPVCVLSSDCSTTSTAEDMQYFEKKTGTACTHFSDFTETAGTLAVTNRVDVAADYVTTPMAEASVELTGTGLMNGIDGMLTSDRIMIIDCGGTCGVSDPSTGLDMPANAGKVETWSKFWPKTFFQDAAAKDLENPVDPERVNEAVDAVEDTLGYYGDTEHGTLEKKYCVGLNMDISYDAETKTGLTVPIEGTSRPVQEYGCYSKCGMESCVGDHCFCDGYLSGYDSATTNAICADVATCQYICDNLEDCKSVDMHADLNRCFLNTAGCMLHESAPGCDVASPPAGCLASDDKYKLLVKREQPNEERRARRLSDPVDFTGDMTPLPTMDLGFSWGSMLRFAPIRFTSGGTFKLCFCDSALGATCRSVADYAVEVGTVHASGVSCLIGKKELQRATCVEQYHGGLRCYRDRAAPEPTAPALSPLSAGEVPGDEYMEALQTYCLYQPEEVGCQIVSGFQSTN
jgi:hypothetical protein